MSGTKVVRNTARPKPPAAGKGRPKGSVNKSTASIKAALTEAFDKRGGVKALLSWADENPTDFYKLWARLLPTEVTHGVTESLEDLITKSWSVTL